MWALLLVVMLSATAISAHQSCTLLGSDAAPRLCEPFAQAPFRTTVIFGTTAITNIYGAEATIIPTHYPDAPGLILQEMRVSREHVLATYRGMEPTTFILPPSPTAWRVQFRSTLVEGHSRVSVNYHDPFLNPLPGLASRAGESSTIHTSSDSDREIGSSQYVMVR